ncbi:TPA: RNA-binding protein [Candidatus Woesearchaeota archaeon]|nr:MAG: putative exosome complex RNA-binding protein 1 [archaeon GW2011_AR11]HIH92170.1 RNA-binding protein [Candidatus Woesearchaeota archaeon]
MTNGLLAKQREVAVPGEVLCRGMDFLPGQGTYRQGDNIHAERLGLVSVEGRSIRIIPLSGKYMPKRDDIIICKVIDITLNGWRLDTNSAYSALLGLKEGSAEFIQRGADLKQIYDLGDYIMCQVIQVTSQKLVDVSMRGPGLRKIKGGRIIEVNPFKVPRIIGKQGSMISMVKQALNCNILVGQNGLIWIHGEPVAEQKAIAAIRKIEEESHVSGLTEKMKDYLQKSASR